ncbi:hypothetical protein [Allosphingosinicella sp.]
MKRSAIEVLLYRLQMLLARAEAPTRCGSAKSISAHSSDLWR